MYILGRAGAIIVKVEIKIIIKRDSYSSSLVISFESNPIRVIKSNFRQTGFLQLQIGKYFEYLLNLGWIGKVDYLFTCRISSNDLNTAHRL
ncbi:hypothetical protein D3C81_1875960 [compost metagenome]